VLHADPARRDSGLALLEAFDSIDLMSIQEASAIDAAVKKVGRVQVMVDRIDADLSRLLPQESGAQKTVCRETYDDHRIGLRIPDRASDAAKYRTPSTRIPPSKRMSSPKRNANASSL
jgi:hypothetical protein